MNDALAAQRDDPAQHAPGALAHRFAQAGLDWIVPQWSAPATVRAFVTTRRGGVSRGAAASLDLGGAGTADATDDDADAVAENRRRVEAFLPSPPRWLRQVHGADVVELARDAERSQARDARAAPGSGAADLLRQDSARWPRADAAFTRDAGVVLAVRVADCMPVLLAERDGEVIAIAHAGWRGLAAGVLERTVAAMRSPPERIVAWLGPAIGPTAFEVGEDVRDAFVASDRASATAFVGARPGKWYADLPALARSRLARAGVHAVAGGELCTASAPERFFSYRRDRSAGRMGAFLWLAGAGEP